MNWNHVKNIFLLLLILVNLLLGFFVYKDYRETAFTPTETAARAVSILAQDGIEVSETLLAVKNDAAATLSVPYDREEYLLTVATFLLGSTPDGVYLLPDGIRAETADGESVLLGNDLSVEFFARDGGADLANGQSRSTAFPTTDEAQKEALAAFGDLLSLSEKELATATLLCKESGWLLTLQQTADGIPLSSCVCVFGMRDGRLVYAEGRHFFGTPEGRTEAPLLDRMNILLKERERGRKGKITDISLCYALYEETERGELLLIPAYTVAYGDGSVSTVNAISGDIVLPLALSPAI